MKVKARAEEKLKEGAKILQMIMLISQLTQADAQSGDENKRQYGPDWIFLVLLAFAALGLVACIRCTVFFVQWLMVRIRLAEAKDRIRARHARDVDRQQQKDEEEEREEEEEALRRRVADARRSQAAEAKAQPKRRAAKAKMKAKAKARAAEKEEEDEEAKRDREELRQRLEEEEEAEGRLATAMARLSCHTPASTGPSSIPHTEGDRPKGSTDQGPHHQHHGRPHRSCRTLWHATWGMAVDMGPEAPLPVANRCWVVGHMIPHP